MISKKREKSLFFKHKKMNDRYFLNVENNNSIFKIPIT